MPAPHSSPSTKPSFSAGRRWAILLNVFLTAALVFAVVVMANFLSRDFFIRWHFGNRGKVTLSSHSRHFVASLTNEVKVTIYYDKNNPLYSTVNDLLAEYHLANPKITVRTVDFLRDAGAAQKLKTDYNLGATSDKNLVIFDCQGKVKRVEGDVLARYVLEQVQSDSELQFRRKPTEFLGELWFTAALLDVSSPHPLKAYFLTGHGEHRIDSGDELTGYLKLAAVWRQNYIEVQPLTLDGTNAIPADANLLVIAGPTRMIPENEVEKLDEYMAHGGRLFILFNAQSLDREIGIERILAKWGVRVGRQIVVDPEHTASGSEVIVSAFSKHPLVNPLLGSGIYMIRPRPIGRLASALQAADAPQVEEIAFTGAKATLYGVPDFPPQRLPLVAVVEKGAIQGVVSERGATRIVVAGDSLFLGNHQLDLLGNRDFAAYAVNWLLDRSQLLQGVGPTKIHEYRLVMTRSQLRRAQWLLLAAMPGTVLAMGGLVWLRRRR